jgi:transposase-like protein
VARRIYTDEDRARAFVVYTTNKGNIKRSVRDLGNIPESTLRGWVREWDENGPPDVSTVAEVAGEFVTDATRVRDKALIELENKLPTAKPSELVATIGMLSDKINMAKGLATSRSETVHQLPPAEDIAKALGSALQAALQAAKGRDMEIIDAEVVQELPASATDDQA